MWAYVGDDGNPYNVSGFTLTRGRDGPKYFLKDYREVLLAGAHAGHNGVVAGDEITRAGCWAHARRTFVEAESDPAAKRPSQVGVTVSGGCGSRSAHGNSGGMR
jgi:hypothetical protein